MRLPRPRSGYLAAAAISLLAFGLRASMTPFLGERTPFLMSVLAVVLSAAYAGLGPGLLATGIGLVLGNLVLATRHSDLLDSSHLIADVSYLAIGVAISWSCESLHVLRRRLESQSAELAERDAFHAAIADLGSDFAVSIRHEPGRPLAVDEVIGGLTRVLGFTPEEIVREGGWKALLPTDPAAAEELSGRIANGVAVHREAWVRSRAGHPVLLYISTRPEYGHAGRLLRTYLAAQDVTRERESEAQLRVSEEHLRLVTETMSAPVTRCSRDLRYLWVNKPYADWIGHPPESIVGRPIREIIGGEAFDKLRPHFELVLAGETVQYEDRVAFAGIGPRWIHGVYTPTRDASGNVDGWVAVVIDIDERKRLEVSLIEADRRKDEFLATLAHELRNPLAPIRNALQILNVASGDRGAEFEARAIMERQLAQMVRLIDDLLDVSRVTRGVLELRRTPVALGEVIRDALETSRPAFEAASHSLSVKVPETPLTVYGDRTRLAQVFANLLNNAAKFTDRGGRIDVAAARDGAEAVVLVRDTGIGIPAEIQPRVFEMFTQADSSIERSRGGLGVGLTIVRKLVEMHGGTVAVESEGDGRGACFIVRLPLDTADRKEVPIEMNGKGNVAPLRVLVVDDNDDAATSMALMLRLHGHEAATATDGAGALASAADGHFDVVLLDIGLPGMDGYEVARRIRGEDWGRDLKLVALTGWGQSEDRRRSREAGFDLHLVKPVPPDRLEQALAGLATAN